MLGIDQREYFHNHRRGVFFLPLYSNYREFLTDKIKESSLEAIELDWFDWWKKKSTQRWNKLDKEDRLETKALFHEKMNEVDLENWLGSRGV